MAIWRYNGDVSDKVTTKIQLWVRIRYIIWQWKVPHSFPFKASIN